MSVQNNEAYWKANLKLVITLLTIWAVVSFGFSILLVDVLNKVSFYGFKLGFWFAQQGSIYVFVVLIFYYAHRMNQIDKQYNLDEGE